MVSALPLIIGSPFVYAGVVILPNVEVVIQQRNAGEVHRAAVEVFLIEVKGQRRAKNKILTARQAVEG
jgi:hypothetical protein